MSEEVKEVTASTETPDLTQQRLDRCLPVAQEILSILAASQPKMGEYEESWDACYNDIAEKVLKLMLEKDIHFSDKEFVFQLLMQPFEATRDFVIKALAISMDKAFEKKFGKDYSDVTFSDMDTILKS